MDIEIPKEDKQSLVDQILNAAKSNMVAQGLNPKLETCCFVSMSSIVPNNLADRFWTTLSQNAPFSWGDNNRSLICACDLLAHIENIEDDFDMTKEELSQITKELKELETTYIDLEN